MTPQERLNYLLEPVTIENNRQVIVADLIEAVGLEGSGLVLGTLQAASAQNPILAAAYQALVTVGISLAGDLRQGMIDQLAAASQAQPPELRWSNELRDAVKRLGRVVQPRWVGQYATEPTLAQIELEVAKQALRQEAAERYNAFVDAVEAWDGSGEEPVL